MPGKDGYEVSSTGLVRSVDRYVPSSRWPSGKRFIPGRVLKPVDSNGYVYVSGGKHTKIKVHVAVAAAFIGPRPDGAVVRHLNGDYRDNRVENLAYGSQSENMQDAVRHGVLWTTKRTHCPKGHPYDEENTYRRGNHRYCRQCARDTGAERARRYRARKRRAA